MHHAMYRLHRARRIVFALGIEIQKTFPQHHFFVRILMRVLVKDRGDNGLSWDQRGILGRECTNGILVIVKARAPQIATKDESDKSRTAWWDKINCRIHQIMCDTYLGCGRTRWKEKPFHTSEYFKLL
eukprot:scaffold3403_cov158-Amphora_coffeaeformis.AAC.5